MPLYLVSVQTVRSLLWKYSSWILQQKPPTDIGMFTAGHYPQMQITLVPVDRSGGDNLQQSNVRDFCRGFTGHDWRIANSVSKQPGRCSQDILHWARLNTLSLPLD